MIADGGMDRVGRLVLVSCETEGNYPPGLAGNAAWVSAKLPGGLSIMRQTLKTPWLRRLPMVYGQMSKRGIPEELYALFGTGYLGYTAARTWGKMKGVER